MRICIIQSRTWCEKTEAGAAKCSIFRVPRKHPIDWWLNFLLFHMTKCISLIGVFRTLVLKQIGTTLVTLNPTNPSPYSCGGEKHKMGRQGCAPGGPRADSLSRLFRPVCRTHSLAQGLLLHLQSQQSSTFKCLSHSFCLSLSQHFAGIMEENGVLICSRCHNKTP